jgi:hypothetical protein
MRMVGGEVSVTRRDALDIKGSRTPYPASTSPDPAYSTAVAAAAAAAAATPASSQLNTAVSTPVTRNKDLRAEFWLEEHLSVRDNAHIDAKFIDGAAHSPHLHHAHVQKKLVPVQKLVEKHKERDYMVENPSPPFEVLNRCQGARIYDPARPRMKFWCPGDVPFQSRWIQRMKDTELMGPTGVVLWMYERSESGEPLEPYAIDSVSPRDFVIVAPDSHGTQLHATAYVVGPSTGMIRYDCTRRSGWVILRDLDTVDMKRTDFHFRPHTPLYPNYGDFDDGDN